MGEVSTGLCEEDIELNVVNFKVVAVWTSFEASNAGLIISALSCSVLFKAVDLLCGVFVQENQCKLQEIVR